MYSLRNRYEKLTEGLLFCLFLKLVQINFIFTDNVRILYIYMYTMYVFSLLTLIISACLYLRSTFIFEVNYRYSKRWHLFVCFFVFFLSLMKKNYRRLINFQPVYFWGKLFIPTLICVSLSLSLCIIKKNIFICRSLLISLHLVFC